MANNKRLLAAQRQAELYEKYQNGIGRHLDMRNIDQYIDVLNHNGKVQLKKYLNFV